jgi:hypothetical protein
LTKHGWKVTDERCRIKLADGHKSTLSNRTIPLRVKIGGKVHDIQFYINPSEEDIILLGVDWLNKTKPQLNFKEQTIKFEERDDGIFEQRCIILNFLGDD